VKRERLAISRFLPKYLRALLGSLFLFTIGVASRRHRYLIFRIAEHFGLKPAEDERRLPVLPLSAVLDAQLNLTLLEPLEKAGNVTLLEMLIISSLARRSDPPIAFEIGTFDGRTTLNIAANLPASGKVYTLDLPSSFLGRTKFKLAPDEGGFAEKEMSGTRFRETHYAHQIEQLYGDSATFDFSPYHGQSGLVFIDGSHAFDYVMQDSQTATHLACPTGAIILWHDYQRDWPDVIHAINQLFTTQTDLFSGLCQIEGTSLVMLKYENTRRPS
jgi:hypothetical protein